MVIVILAQSGGGGVAELGDVLGEMLIREAKKLESKYWKFVRFEKNKRGRVCAIFRSPRTGRETTTEFKVGIGKKRRRSA